MGKIDITKTVQNFGKLKNVYNDILVESVVSKDKDKKNLFKDYVKTIKENVILKNQFLIYNLIENKIESNETKAKTFLDECLDIISKFDKKDIMEANSELLTNILFENDNDYDKKELHEHLSFLIFTNKTPKTIDRIIESKEFVINYILNNKEKEVSESFNLPNSMLSNLMVEKYNEKYSDLDESDKKIIKALVDSNDEEKKTVYSETIRECINLIDEKLTESDLDTKDRLLKVKDKLLNDKLEINEDYVKNISRLVDLKNSLKTK
jgi:hypothetical protein